MCHADDAAIVLKSYQGLIQLLHKVLSIGFGLLIDTCIAHVTRVHWTE